VEDFDDDCVLRFDLLLHEEQLEDVRRFIAIGEKDDVVNQ